MIFNVTVTEITPEYLIYMVSLWRERTKEEKELNPSGSITAHAIRPAAKDAGAAAR
jgi:hypothetical protein